MSYTIVTNTGKEYDLNDVPLGLYPMFCRECGSRLGWATHDIPCYGYIVCEDCIHILKTKEV